MENRDTAGMGAATQLLRAREHTLRTWHTLAEKSPTVLTRHISLVDPFYLKSMVAA